MFGVCGPERLVLLLDVQGSAGVPTASGFREWVVVSGRQQHAGGLPEEDAVEQQAVGGRGYLVPEIAIRSQGDERNDGCSCSPRSGLKKDHLRGGSRSACSGGRRV